jgi:hypothetical protein
LKRAIERAIELAFELAESRLKGIEKELQVNKRS